MKKTQSGLILLFLVIGLILGGYSVALAEEEEKEVYVIGEITVTAQRREQNVQDVPIAMTALSGEDMDTLRLEQTMQLADQIPNMYIAESSGENTYLNISIRGVNNQQLGFGTATSAAVYSDEMILDSWMLHSQAMFDLERVEVLRGPQGTLFGRNSTSGALQFVSAKPGDEMDGYLQLTYGKYNRVRVEGAIGGPIFASATDKARARLAFYYDKKDGYLENIKNGEDDIMASDEYAFRGILELAPTDEIDIFFKAQMGSIDHEPMLLPNTIPPPSPYAYIDWVADPSDFYNPGPESDYEKVNVNLRSDELAEEVDNYLFDLVLNWDVGNVLLTSVTGYANVDHYYLADGDGSAQTIGHEHFAADLTQVSQELRLTSLGESPFQWIVGGFYLKSEYEQAFVTDFTDFFTLGYPSNDPQYGYVPEEYTDRYDEICADPSLGLTCLVWGGVNYFQPPANTGYGEGYWGEHDSESYSAFVHTTYTWTDNISTTHAFRYTHDELDARNTGAGVSMFARTSNLDYIDLSAHTPLFWAFAGYANSASWDSYTWRLAGEYSPRDDLLLYASISTGYKAGIVADNPYVASQFRSVEPETVVSYETGIKSTWFDKRLLINGALYYADYTDLQNYEYAGAESTITGLPIRVYVNVPEVTYFGGEVEVLAMPITNLTIMLGLGVTDSEIDEYFDKASDDLGNPIDYTGNEVQGTPGIDHSGSIQYDIPLGAAGVLSPQFDWHYIGRIWADWANELEAGDFWEYNASLTYRNDSTGLSVRLFVENIADDRNLLLKWMDAAGATAYGSDFAVLQRPQTWGIIVSYDF